MDDSGGEEEKPAGGGIESEAPKNVVAGSVAEILRFVVVLHALSLIGNQDVMRLYPHSAAKLISEQLIYKTRFVHSISLA